MSAYVVSDETINKVVSFLFFKQYDNMFYANAPIKEVYGDMSNKKNCAKLAQDMFNLNVEAVNQRYGQGEAQKFRPLNFKFQLINCPADSIKTLKALECWIYQCSEGNIPETPLFKTMESFLQLLALSIVRSLPAYEKAPWS